MIAATSRWMALLGSISLLAPAQLHRTPPLWHRVQRIVDVTGDGKPDTLTLAAFGTQPDTLDVVLTIRSAGREVYSDRWINTDEFIDYDSTLVRNRSALARDVRHKFDVFFNEKNFSPIRDEMTTAAASDSASGSDCGPPLQCVASDLQFEKATAARVARGLSPVPQTASAYGALLEAADRVPIDSALVRRIGAEWRRSRALSFTYTHGYETTQTIAWSEVARRFFVVFECC